MIAVLLALCHIAAGTDLSYPAPPNPFAPPRPSLSKEPEPLPAERAKQPRWKLRWQPAACLGLMALSCAVTRPHEASLLSALELYHERSAGLIPLELREAQVCMHDGRLGCVALHSEIFWLGLLGQWIPLLPTSIDALHHWVPSLSAAQLLIYSTAVGYILRRLLPRFTSDSHFATSFQNVAQRGRVWTLLTSAFSTNGLVHWLHCCLLLLVIAPELETLLGRWRAIGVFAAAGVSASAALAIAQVPFRKRASARSSLSGAVMGMIALRGALVPRSPAQVGGFALPIGRLLLLHLLLEANSNPTPRPVGAERLIALLGGCSVVLLQRQQLLTLMHGSDWRQLWDYIKAAI